MPFFVVGFNAPTFILSEADRQGSALMNADGLALRDPAATLSDPNSYGGEKLNKWA